MDSTWDLGMTFRVIIPTVVLSLTVNAVCAEAPVNAFVKAQLAAPVSVQSITVTGDVSRVCADVLGRPYAHASIPCWGSATGNVWVVAARGKHGPITAAFAVEDGRIRASTVLADKEPRGRVIRSQRFLRQFRGVGLRRGKKLDRRIDGITGATVSSTAMTKMALLALRLDHMHRIEYRSTDAGN